MSIKFSVNAQITVTKSDEYNYAVRNQRSVKLDISETADSIDKMAERLAALVKEAAA